MLEYRSFTQSLMHWNKEENHREMPWKGIKDPYKIWLSEVILQQTRVEQGWNYYNKFIQNFPKIEDLAKADDNFVFKLWEGLGYYNRCKNLLTTARNITDNFGGKFPDNYNQIIDLKGIGPYTAAAIASFAFNLPYAVVDGNVFRVLSRYTGNATPIDTTEGKKIFAELAEQFLDKKEPGIYNQAIMDFGATVCTPFSPQCTNCPIANNCTAYNTGQVNMLPIKEKILTKKNRHFTWLVLKYQDKYFAHLRTQKDIWSNLNEFYLIETEQKIKWNKQEVQNWLQSQWRISGDNILISKELTQQLTHQTIKAIFILIHIKIKPDNLTDGHWFSLKELQERPFPKLPKMYIEEVLMHL